MIQPLNLKNRLLLYQKHPKTPTYLGQGLLAYNSNTGQMHLHSKLMGPSFQLPITKFIYKICCSFVSKCNEHPYDGSWLWLLVVITALVYENFGPLWLPEMLTPWWSLNHFISGLTLFQAPFSSFIYFGFHFQKQYRHDFVTLYMMTVPAHFIQLLAFLYFVVSCLIHHMHWNFIPPVTESFVTIAILQNHGQKMVQSSFLLFFFHQYLHSFYGFHDPQLYVEISRP